MIVSSFTVKGAQGGARTLQKARGLGTEVLNAVLGRRTWGCDEHGTRTTVSANGTGWTPCTARAAAGGQAPARDEAGRAVSVPVNLTHSHRIDPVTGQVYRISIRGLNRDAHLAGGYDVSIVRVN